MNNIKNKIIYTTLLVVSTILICMGVGLAIYLCKDVYAKTIEGLSILDKVLLAPPAMALATIAGFIIPGGLGLSLIALTVDCRKECKKEGRW